MQGDSDPAAMSVRELKAYLGERGVSIVGTTEKHELMVLALGAKAKERSKQQVRMHANEK